MLDLSGANGSNGANIQGWAANGSEAQRWLIDAIVDPRADIDKLAASCKDSVADGTYSVTSSLEGARALDVQWASADNGANIQTYAANQSAAQQWKISHDGKGYLTITSAASNKVLDVSGGSTAPGANVQQYESNGTFAQKWIAVPVGDGAFVVVSALASDLALDIAAAGDYDGANVQIYTRNDSAAQVFKFAAVA